MGHLVAVYPGVDEQHAGPALHDHGVAPAELALVEQPTVRDLPAVYSVEVQTLP